MWSSLLLTALLVGPCLGTIVKRLEDISDRAYDFIVVGGGTAGLAVANRLTEDPKFSVLVIEAGGSHEDFPFSRIVFFNGKLFDTAADWNYTTTPMEGLNGKSVWYPQGHVLGGTSTINGAAYTRGSADDYNRYARLSGDEGWSWNNLQPYFRKNEKWVAPADNHNIVGQFDPAVHGFDGVTAVSLPGYTFPVDAHIIKAAKEQQEFPFVKDMNSGEQIGIGWTQSTIKDGVRSSSATSYLAPEYAKRPNLDVLLNTRVTRVIPTNFRVSGQRLDLRTVEFVSDADAVAATLDKDFAGARPRTARPRTLTATKELILSAGVINTPHILQHSGIGDPAILSPLGIRPIFTLPDVGKNLSDHVFVANTWQVKDGLESEADSFEGPQRNEALMQELLKQWEEGGKGKGRGPYGASTFNQAGWFRVPDKDAKKVFEGVEDPASGKKSAHFEFIIANGKTRPPIPPTGNFMVIGTVVVTPLSRGTVYPTSPSPFSPPSINPNLFASPVDLALMRSAIRAARRFVSNSPSLQTWVSKLVDTAETDEELDAFIRDTGLTVSHCVGTSAMSPKGAKWGVVDPDLRVKGVRGVRIVDAGVLPVTPAGHSQAATYVVAERASDLIKASWRV